MRITFQKVTVAISAKYKCKCGHKFTRKNSDWFTINPFNTKTPEELRRDLLDKQSKRVRECPKCKEECSPL